MDLLASKILALEEGFEFIKRSTVHGAYGLIKLTLAVICKWKHVWNAKYLPSYLGCICVTREFQQHSKIEKKIVLIYLLCPPVVSLFDAAYFF